MAIYVVSVARLYYGGLCVLISREQQLRPQPQEGEGEEEGEGEGEG